MFKKSILNFIVVFFLVNSQITHSQIAIKTLTAFKQKTNYLFSHEWQYLSTDLYLLNEQKFSNLLNDIASQNSGGKKRKGNKEILQSLFIKAKIQNLKFLGGDVVYPIYNFKVSESKEYKTVETGSVEVVRLIDNLPLNESNEVIDAEITGEAITEKNSNEFLKLIGQQLQGLSKYTAPNIAVLDLIGELGKYIESKTAGKQYKFSSTIRLYEGQEFDKRLHSVNIFVFVPSSVSKVNIMADALSSYIDSNESPIISQEILSKMVNYKKYPIIVIANYKSRYNTQLVTGDQINFDYLNSRKLKIQNAFQNELINKTTYEQEIKLIEFLEIFADLKLNINNYKLNLKNNITNDYSKNHFVILKIYRDLLKTINTRTIQYYNNTEFEKEFLPKYESVITTAGLYLSEQNSLTNIKEGAELLEKNKSELQNLKTEDIDNNLRVLYSIKIPDDEAGSEQAKEIKRLISIFEQELYIKTYIPIIAKINLLLTNEKGLQEKEKIESQMSNTYCTRCKKELNIAVNNYMNRYQEEEKNALLQQNENIRQISVGTLFKLFEKKRCADEFLKQQSDSLTTYKELITIELNKLNEMMEETRELLKQKTNDMDIRQLKEQNFMLDAYIKKLDAGFITLCKNLDNNCICNDN